MTHQVTVPPDVVAEVMARAIRAKLTGGYRPSKATETIIKHALDAGYQCVVDFNGEVAVNQNSVEGKMRQVRPTFTRAQLSELLNLAMKFLDTKRGEFVVHRSHYQVNKTKWAASLLSRRLHKAITSR